MNTRTLQDLQVGHIPLRPGEATLFARLLTQALAQILTHAYRAGLPVRFCFENV